MIGKRAIKSKPNTRRITARAGNREIYSNRSKEHAKAREGKRAGSGPRPSRYETQLPLRPRQAGASPPFPGPASRSTGPSALRLEDLARRVCASQRPPRSLSTDSHDSGFVKRRIIASQRCQAEDILRDGKARSKERHSHSKDLQEI
jgi:hypothetical protein